MKNRSQHSECCKATPYDILIFELTKELVFDIQE